MQVYLTTVPANPPFEMLFEELVQAQAFCLREFGKVGNDGQSIDLETIGMKELVRLKCLPSIDGVIAKAIQKQIDQLSILEELLADAELQRTQTRGKAGTISLAETYPNLLRVRTYVKDGKTIKTVELVV